MNSQIRSITEKSISGDYLWFIPKDSFFIFPSKGLSKSISAEMPSISSIYFYHKGLTSIAAMIKERVPYVIVCINQRQGDCYYADDKGFIFQAASSTEGAMLVYNISLPKNANPIGIDFLDSTRLQWIGSFVGSLSRLGFIDENIDISTSTDYDLSLDYQKFAIPTSSILSSSIPSSSPSVLHLIIDESKPLVRHPPGFRHFGRNI